MDGETAIQLTGICKHFGPVKANENIDLKVAKGKIHGIIGENGAGKSTLMSILYGFYTADKGQIHIVGRSVSILNSQDAITLGIGMVHQHFMLVDTFSVLENLILGAEDTSILKDSMGKARQKLAELGETYGLELDPDARVRDLPVGLQQRVEILKALYRGAEILILDEPTGVLTPQEADRLFKILDRLREQGVTILLITHKLREIMAICDQVSVMRGGRMVAHRDTKETNREELAELMVGRKVLMHVDKGLATPGVLKLSLKSVSYVDDQGVKRLKGVSLDVHAGEIVCIAGVSGNGQSALMDVISGINAFQSGSIHIGSTRFDAGSALDPERLRQLSVGHVPEDRLKSGLVTSFPAKDSSILGYHKTDAYNAGLLQDRKAILEDCEATVEAYDVRPPNPNLKTANFSGGNQQKLVLAREFSKSPDLLLIEQPTRGVDIGAIEFIHRQIIKMRDAGKAILLVSVELDEVMSLADRILVMFDGAIVGEVEGTNADEVTLGLMMANAHG